MTEKSSGQKRRLRKNHLYDNFLKIGVTALIGPQQKAVDYVRKNTDADIVYSETRDGFFARNDSEAYFWVNNKESISHECVHLVMWAFDLKGIPICFENEETFAYYLDFWKEAFGKFYS